MLQQTRVSVVEAYYRRFLTRFPDVSSLAAAGEDEVLALWSGLGYYRRARMLHAAAKLIAAREHFPRTSEDWRALPGVGRYTAAAIASICFGEPTAVVDGNVGRVLLRLGSTGDPWKLANALLAPRRPGDFNQAIMELGALVCTPKSPRCGECPLRRWCKSRSAVGTTHTSPAQKRRQRTLIYAMATRGNAIYLVQRPASARLMPSMWELPQSDTRRTMLFTLKHSITTTDYLIRIRRATPRDLSGGQWFHKDQLPTLALTGVSRKALRRIEWLTG